MDNIFSGLSLILVIGTLMALAMRAIRQPLIIAYILTGVIVGPAVLHLTKDQQTFQVFSDIGVALLLFIIGLGLNPRVIREVGHTATVVGLSQVAIITVLGWLIGLGFGLSSTPAAFLGASLAFSSTIIILKLLTDKKEQSRLYGKIAISISLVQDLVAIALVVITSGGSDQNLAISSVLALTVKGALIALAMYWFTSMILPSLQKTISNNQEFLFLFAIACGLGGASLFAKAGLSSEIGALLAGICLASQPYAQEISSRLRPLRDFFLIVFFITLGAGLTFYDFSAMLGLVIASVTVAVIVKPLVAMAGLGLLGYTKRTSFKASVALAQVSEFSIVLIVLGRNRGLINSDLASTITLITLISIAVSSYLVTFSDKLFANLEVHLDLFERRKTNAEPRVQANYELVLLGYQKGGHEFVRVFKQISKNFVVIDYDPEVIDTLEQRKINHLYGDATDMELLEEAGVDKAKLVVSTITDFETTKQLLNFLSSKESDAVVIAQADSAQQAAELYRHGASYVILPHFIGGEQIGAFVKKSGLKKTAFKKFRDEHLKYLEDQFGILDEEAIEHQKIGHTIVESMAALTKSKS
ncbi:MAG TPA: cation:proton antiporter [Candidatus Saccharimonadales bacterium]|nr:cation:proton antiporter [Candidatus Saccharimonadales bacterium]